MMATIANTPGLITFHTVLLSQSSSIPPADGIPGRIGLLIKANLSASAIKNSTGTINGLLSLNRLTTWFNYTGQN